MFQYTDNPNAEESSGGEIYNGDFQSRKSADVGPVIWE